MVHQLDPRRGAGATGPHARVGSYHCVDDLVPGDLAECGRDAERACTARKTHRFQCVARRDGLPALFGIRDALRGEQRTFDLHEMNVGWIGDLRFRHRSADALGNDVDLCDTSQLLGFDEPAYARVQSQALDREPDSSRRSNTVQCGAIAALGAAGHDQADVSCACAKMLLKHQRSGSAWRTRA